MKSLLFKTAWKLVKNLGITIGEALHLAWNEYKIKGIYNRINALELKYMTADERAELKALYSKVRPMETENNRKNPKQWLSASGVNSMEGAQHWYGAGTYNGD